MNMLDRLWWYPTGCSQCCDDALNMEYENGKFRYFCSVCNEQVDQGGVPLDNQRQVHILEERP